MSGKFFRARHARKAQRNVSRMLAGQALTLVDIGAAGGVQPRWKQITRHTSYIGFEPDARSNLDTGQLGNDFASYSVIPAAVWSHDGELHINLCRKPQNSSHYLPNVEFVSRFPRSERFDVLGTATVTASRLDALSIDKCDFIKLDIQGGELSALQGGGGLLASAFGLEVEVEFLPQYRDQPLFGDVCAHLSGQGFEFIDFTHLSRWDRRVKTRLGQCVFGDALFLRTPERLRLKLDEAAISLADLRRYVAILALYRRVDLIAACQGLFHEALQQEPELARDIDFVIGNLDRELGRVHRLTEVSGWFLKTLASNMRLHINY